MKYGCVFFIALYLFAIIASISRFETLNSRFMAPASFHWYGVVAVGLFLCLKSWQIKKRNGCFYLPVHFFLGFPVQPACRRLRNPWMKLAFRIPGYIRRSINGDILRRLFIQKDSLPSRKVTMIPIQRQRCHLFFLPWRHGKFLPHVQRLPGVNQFLNDRHCYVVWFNGMG